MAEEISILDRGQLALDITFAAQRIIIEGIESGVCSKLLNEGGNALFARQYLENKQELLQLAEGYPPRWKAVKRLLELISPEVKNPFEKQIIQDAIALCGNL